MPLLETFDSSLGNYVVFSTVTPAWVRFQGSDGNPAAGCARIVSETIAAAPNYYSAFLKNNTDTYTLVNNAPSLWFNGKFSSSIDLSSFFTTVSLTVTINFTAPATQIFTQYFGFVLVGASAGGANWVQVQIAMPGKVIGDEITEIIFCATQSAAANSPVYRFTALIDSITVATSAPAFNATPPGLPLPLRLVSGRYSGGINTGNVAEIAAAVYPVVCNLSATKAIVAFVDDSTGTGRVQVVNKTDLTLTPAASSYSLGAGTVPAAVFALSSTKAVALYEPGAAVILDVSGDVITVGTPVALEAGAIYISGSRLTATKFFISYVVATVARGVVASVTGSTITLNTPANASSNNSEETSCATLVDDTTVILAYHSAADTIRAVALTISGVGFSIADDELIDSNVSGPMGLPMVSKLDATRVVVTWFNNVTEFDCKAAIVTLAGAALGPGAILTYSTGAASRFYPAVGALSADRIAAAYVYSDALRAKTLSAVSGTVSDNNNEVNVASSGNTPSVAVMKAI